METLFGVILSGLIGISLAAACGFRVFVPMLVMSIAVHAGQLELAEEWNWIGSWPALGAFAVAAVAEIGCFFIPGVDHLLDAVATPAAVVAGTIATGACIAEMDPLLKWSASIIAGGGIAGVIQSTTVVARAASTFTTGGFGNAFVSLLELAMSCVLAILAVVVPIAAGLVVCLVAFWVVRVLLRRRRRAAAKG